MRTDFHAILRHNARELSREDIEKMSWDVARAYYYANKEAWRASRPRDTRQTVCFTGFTASEKDALIKIAESGGTFDDGGLARELLIADRTASPAGEGLKYENTGTTQKGYDKSDTRPIISPVAQALLAKFGLLLNRKSGAVRLVRA